jgi:hypothetical protein
VVHEVLEARGVLEAREALAVPVEAPGQVLKQLVDALAVVRLCLKNGPPFC